MFRGFELAQLRAILALLTGLFLGIIITNWNHSAPTPVPIRGPVEVHPPGELVAKATPAAAPSPSPTAAPEATPAAEATQIAAKPGLAPGGLVDLNTASVETLDLLPGIGESRARAIVELRAAKGGFKRVEDLGDVPGIGDKTLARLRPMLTLSSGTAAPVAPSAAATPAPPVPINRADVEQLQELEAVGPVMARRILEERVRNGPFRSPQDLLRVPGIGEKFLEKNRGRIDFNP